MLRQSRRNEIICIRQQRRTNLQQMTEHEVLTRKILQKLCQNGSLAENGTIFEEKKIDSCAVEQLSLLDS